MFKNLRMHFLTGMAMLLPILATIWILIKGVGLADIFLTKIIVVTPLKESLMYAFPWSLIVKFVALLIVVFSISFFGLIGKNVFGRKFLGYLEQLVERIPLVSKIYQTIKQMRDAFIGEKMSSYRKVVMIEYPRKGVYSLALVTSEARGEIKEKSSKKMISVFVPTTPNPTSGYLLMVPEEDAIYMDMSVEEGLKFIVSAGSLLPSQKR